MKFTVTILLLIVNIFLWSQIQWQQGGAPVNINTPLYWYCDGVSLIEENVFYIWTETTENNPDLYLQGYDADGLSLWPNPFNPQLHIQWTRSKYPPQEIAIYNLKGECVKKWQNAAGKEYLIWNGENSSGKQCASGLYTISIKTTDGNINKKAILLK